ncbi:MAG: START domain-containing protein [Pseudomonadota bacterium]
MRRFLLSLLLLCVAAPVAAVAPPPWEYSGETQGIKIWTRQIPGNPVKDFRAVMTVDAPLATVVATLTDVNTIPQWFWMMTEARTIEGSTLDDAYLYFAIGGIWPVSARDSVIRCTVAQDPATLAISINATAAPDRMPPVKNHVRIPQMDSAWTLVPLSKTQTRVELIGNADPGGYIPLWLANMVVTTMPKETFRKLRRHLADPRYRDVAALSEENPMLRDFMSRVRVP